MEDSVSTVGGCKDRLETTGRSCFTPSKFAVSFWVARLLRRTRVTVCVLTDFITITTVSLCACVDCALGQKKKSVLSVCVLFQNQTFKEPTF